MPPLLYYVANISLSCVCHCYVISPSEVSTSWHTRVPNVDLGIEFIMDLLHVSFGPLFMCCLSSPNDVFLSPTSLVAPLDMCSDSYPFTISTNNILPSFAAPSSSGSAPPPHAKSLWRLPCLHLLFFYVASLSWLSGFLFYPRLRFRVCC